MKRAAIAAALACALCSCATLGKVVRTIDVVARDLCEIWGAEHRAELGVSPAEFCAVRKNVAPFVEAAKMAKSAAGAEAAAGLHAR